MMVWTIEANGAEPIVETYGYRTDLLDTYTNAEQRVKLRAIALEMIEFSFLTTSARESQRASALVYGLQDENVVVPLWQYGSRLTSGMGVGAFLIPITDALLVPYKLGTYAVLWSDPFTFELFRVGGASGAGVTALDAAKSTWPAQSYVFPAREARLPERGRLRWESSRFMTGRLRFVIDELAVSSEPLNPAAEQVAIVGRRWRRKRTRVVLSAHV